MSEDPARPQKLSFEQEMVDATAVWWQMPAILFTSWYNLMSGAWHPGHALRPHCGPHEQLVVPEPLEISGEDTLFA